MVTSRQFTALVAASLFALTGCELIGGIEQRTLLNIDQGDGGIDASDDGDVVIPDAPPDEAAIPTKCELPTEGNATIRVGNMIPSLGRVDFCIKSAEEPDWSAVDPVLAGGGGACARGLGYRDVAAAFPVTAGALDIIAIEDKGTATPPKCTDAPVAQSPQIVLAEGETVSALLFGDTVSGSVLQAWKETRPAGLNESVVRFVNGLVGSSKLDCGIALVGELPTEIFSEGFSNVPFASFTPPADQGVKPAGKIDANGYMQLQVGGATVPFAIANSGETTAMLVKSEKFERNASYTLFALGRVGDKNFPEEMLICDEAKADGIYSRCGGVPLSVTVDSLNVQLAGAFGPFDKERLTPIEDAIKALPSDVVCVQEAWGPTVKNGIADAVAAKFPNQAVFMHDLDSAVDDATDQNGDSPPEYTEAPCAQSLTKFNAAMDCVRDNCAEPKQSEAGIPAAQLSDCMTSKCIGTLLPILSGTPEDRACYSCMFGNLAAWETMGYIRDECSTNPKARYAHRGDTAVMVFSKHPINNAESWVIGSTEWRVDIVRAPIDLPNGASVDVYCTQLTTPGSGIARPYTGQYGNGKQSDQAWLEELYLQANKLVNYVQTRSAATNRKALIVGTIYSGPEYPGIDPVNIDAYNTISGAFPLAVPQDYVPSCTLCNDNPIISPPGSNPTGSNSWQSFVFMSDLPVTAAESASVFAKETVLTVTNPATQEPYDIPLSSHYGFRSVVRVMK